MVVSNWHRSQFSTFGCSIEFLDDRLALGFHLADRDFHSMNLRLNSFVQLLSVIPAIQLAITVIVTVWFNGWHFVPAMVAWMTYAMPNAVAVLTLMQYFSALFMMQQRFDCVAVSLWMCRRRTDGGGEKRRKRRMVSGYGNWLMPRLLLAQLVYRELGVVERSLHRFFGLLMASTIVTSILMVTVGLYQFYVLAVKGMTLPWLVASIVSLIMHLGKLCVGLYMSTMADEAVRSLPRAGR